MTASELFAARDKLRLTKAAFARQLGIAENSYRAYETGTKPIPRTVALAVAAIMRGIGPWPE